jgi:hypothetical protein
MKQVQPNPWDKVAERYPPGTVITGNVCNLTNYGAFIEIEEGIDGLLHVADMSWVRKIGHPSEVLTKGDRATCVVLRRSAVMAGRSDSAPGSLLCLAGGQQGPADLDRTGRDNRGHPTGCPLPGKRSPHRLAAVPGKGNGDTERPALVRP